MLLDDYFGKYIIEIFTFSTLLNWFYFSLNIYLILDNLLFIVLQ